MKKSFLVLFAVAVLPALLNAQLEKDDPKYQAAILAKVSKEVYTVEIKEKLYEKSSRILHSLKFENIKTRHGDGYFGWIEAAPFDCIMITAAIDHIPPPLLKQLKNGG